MDNIAKLANSKNIYFEEFKDGQFYYNSEIITVIDKYLNKIKLSEFSVSGVRGFWQNKIFLVKTN